MTSSGHKSTRQFTRINISLANKSDQVALSLDFGVLERGACPGRKTSPALVLTNRRKNVRHQFARLNGPRENLIVRDTSSLLLFSNTYTDIRRIVFCFSCVYRSNHGSTRHEIFVIFAHYGSACTIGIFHFVEIEILEA